MGAERVEMGKDPPHALSCGAWWAAGAGDRTSNLMEAKGFPNFCIFPYLFVWGQLKKSICRPTKGSRCQVAADTRGMRRNMENFNLFCVEKVSDTFPGQTQKQTENFSLASYEIAYYPHLKIWKSEATHRKVGTRRAGTH